MGRFDFQSPGAAFTESMAQTLAQRKAEDRQRLLDSLSINADTRAAEESVRQAKVTDSSLQSAGQEREIQRVAALTSHMSRGADISTLAPEDQALLQKYQAVTAAKEPDASATITGMKDETGAPTTDFTPTAEPQTPVPTKPKYSFAGTREEQDRDRKRDQAGVVISELIKDPKTQEAGMFLARISAANDGEIPAGAWEQAGIAPPTPLSIFHEASGKVTSAGNVPANSKVITQGYSPRELRGRQLVPAGFNEQGETMLYDPDTNKTITVPGSHKGANPDEASLGVPIGLAQAYQASVSGLAESEPTFGFGGGNIDAAGLKSARLAAGSIIAAAKADPTVKELAGLAVNNPTLFDARLKSVDMDEHQMNQLRQLLGLLVTPELRELYRKHPAGGNTPTAPTAAPSKQPWGSDRPATGARPTSNSIGTPNLTSLLLDRSGGQ